MKQSNIMEKDLLFKIVFTIIIICNLVLAVWNYMKSDFLESGISALIVLMIIVWFFASRKKT